MNNAIYRFLTRDNGSPRTYGLVVDRRRENGAHATRDLHRLAAMANDHPGVCAFGKIAVLAAEGIFSFQATREGETSPVFCGNSTAAALACLGGGALRIALHGMAAVSYDVSWRVEGNTIVQSWILPPGGIAERSWRGRRVLRLQALNEYAIVCGELPDGVGAEAARRELLGARVGGKLAVITGGDGDPVVHFYNSNGRHGAVPQTGIASIALAARSTTWLRERFPGGEMTYLAEGGPRKAYLPAIADTACGRVELAMPGIEVVLSQLVTELAA